MLFCGIVCHAAVKKVGDFNYELGENKTATLIGIEAGTINAVIPNLITADGADYDVTALGYGCFRDCVTLETIDIPKSISKIYGN